MDEPLSALDKKLRERCRSRSRQLHDRLGITTVYVTHDQREALTMSDRIAVINHGRMIQQSTRRARSTSGRATGSSPISSASRLSCRSRPRRAACVLRAAAAGSRARRRCGRHRAWCCGRSGCASSTAPRAASRTSFEGAHRLRCHLPGRQPAHYVQRRRRRRQLAVRRSTAADSARQRAGRRCRVGFIAAETMTCLRPDPRRQRRDRRSALPRSGGRSAGPNAAALAAIRREQLALLAPGRAGAAPRRLVAAAADRLAVLPVFLGATAACTPVNYRAPDRHPSYRLHLSPPSSSRLVTASASLLGYPLAYLLSQLPPAAANL